MASIKETKEFLAFLLSMGNAVKSSLGDDGQITFNDAPLFLSALLNSPKAITGINKIGAELMDLDDEEQDELADFISSGFDIPDDQLEFIIESLFRSSLGMFSAFAQLYKYKKQNNEADA